MTTHKQFQRDSVALRIDDLGKQYPNGTWGLRHATASLQAGRMTAVLGPNGAGKSTLIHMLAKAIHPSEGTVTLADPSARIGWASQRTTIDWYLNVIDNVVIGARLHGIGREESRKRSLQMLETLQLGDLALNDVSMLSGGQQQRIQVARTLVADPDILLLDEPTASLDVEAAESVLDHLRARALDGALVLVSSHDLGLLEQFCDEVIFIHNGRLIAHQPMAAFLRRFAPSDAITIQYEGELSSVVLDQLAPFDPKVNAHAKLTVTMPDGMPLGALIAMLEPEIRVLDAGRERASLRAVYRQMTRQEGDPA